MAHIVVNSGVSVVEIWLEVKKVKLVSMSKHFSACEFNARLPHSHIKMMITTIAQNVSLYQNGKNAYGFNCTFSEYILKANVENNSQ